MEGVEGARRVACGVFPRGWLGQMPPLRRGHLFLRLWDTHHPACVARRAPLMSLKTAPKGSVERCVNGTPDGRSVGSTPTPGTQGVAVVAGLGVAGKARQGMAGQGRAWQGVAGEEQLNRRGGR